MLVQFTHMVTILLYRFVTEANDYVRCECGTHKHSSNKSSNSKSKVKKSFVKGIIGEEYSYSGALPLFYTESVNSNGNSTI